VMIRKKRMIVMPGPALLAPLAEHLRQPTVQLIMSIKSGVNVSQSLVIESLII
jgi:hypothetical protein